MRGVLLLSVYTMLTVLCAKLLINSRLVLHIAYLALKAFEELWAKTDSMSIKVIDMDGNLIGRSGDV